jgi:hypothetical protein
MDVSRYIHIKTDIVVGGSNIMYKATNFPVCIANPKLYLFFYTYGGY